MTATAVSLADLGSLIDRELGPSDPVLVDQAMVDLFAKTTGDRQWVHVDVDRAKAEMDGAIAHGYLILSLIPLYVSRLLDVANVSSALNYGLERVRFLSPVRPPAMTTATLCVRAVEDKGGGALMRTDVTISQVGAQKPACVATTMTLLLPGEGRFGPFDI